MSLLAETVVEEYFNYHGYFTIRGLKIGLDEIDLLAVKLSNKNNIECLHIEVQVSEKPVNYISHLTEEIRKRHDKKSKTSAIKRTREELILCVAEWVKKKFNHPGKKKLRAKLFPNQEWKFMFVHGNIKDRNELDILEKHSVETIDIKILIHNLSKYYLKKYKTSSIGRDIINLFKLFEVTLDEKKD